MESGQPRPIVLISFIVFVNLFGPASAQSIENTSDNGGRYGVLFITLLVTLTAAFLLRKRLKRERKYFAAEIKRDILKKQRHKCIYCRWIPQALMMTTIQL